MDSRVLKPSRAALAVLVLSSTACAGTHETHASGAKTTPVAPSIAAMGQLAPPWSDRALTGGELTNASFQGRPVYLNFFASWCGPCNEEASSIETLSKTYKANGLVVVGVDEAENATKADGFRRAHGLTYPIVVDADSMRDSYGVNGLPEHVFIDRRGVVHDLVEGEMSPSDIEAQIRAIVAKGS